MSVERLNVIVIKAGKEMGCFVKTLMNVLSTNIIAAAKQHV
jgi:hypothetical protein